MGESHQKIRHTWKNAVRRGIEWGNRSCGASANYRDWLRERAQKVGLPQGESQCRDKEVHAYEVHETLRRKLEEVVTTLAFAEQEVNRKRQLSDQVSKRSCAKEKDKIKIGSCLRAADQEMCFRRVERDRVAQEKEQLKEALSVLKEREAEREAQFLRLQEKTHLLEEELARAKLSKECLIAQRRERIFELVKARAKTEEAEAHFQATI
ncbi:hypothetical protein CR513_35918, partial [Mucuna pruriens]